MWGGREDTLEVVEVDNTTFGVCVKFDSNSIIITIFNFKKVRHGRDKSALLSAEVIYVRCTCEIFTTVVKQSQRYTKMQVIHPTPTHHHRTSTQNKHVSIIKDTHLQPWV